MVTLSDLSDEEAEGGNGTSIELLDTSKDIYASRCGIGNKTMNLEALQSRCKKSLWQAESVYEVMGKED